MVAVCGLILGGRCVQSVMTEAEMEPAQVMSDQVMGGGGWRGVGLSCGNNQIFRACPAHGLDVRGRGIREKKFGLPRPLPSPPAIAGPAAAHPAWPPPPEPGCAPFAR